MSIVRQHLEWLRLVEVSGPFLSLPVLQRVFPQGLDKPADEGDLLRDVRLAHEDWTDAVAGRTPDPALHNAWIRFVLGAVLDLPADHVWQGQSIPPTLRADFPEHAEILRPDLVVAESPPPRPRVLIQVYPSSQDLERSVAGRRWAASPLTRMMELLHGVRVPLGLVTNGASWTLVYAPCGETTGCATWTAQDWIDEPVTLRAFRSLLGARRLFGVAPTDTLESMLAESAQNQHEVTTQLGLQVRRAVEVVVEALDRADRDVAGRLLHGVAPTQVFEAAVTLMMRLVFLLCAEERRLLPADDPLYADHYAVSGLLDRLEAVADHDGEEVLETRFDAWHRLLAVFRAVHGGIGHDRLRLPAYGGSLFDPDRFPFLEGRAPGTGWRNTPAAPLPIHNRTTLHLLRALQRLEGRIGKGPAESRRLSFQSLDIEQIGHVYEGLLDHTALRAREGQPVLGLAGAKGQEPELGIAELERLRAQGADSLVDYLREQTGRSEAALRRALTAKPDMGEVTSLRAACGNDNQLFERVRPFVLLLRANSLGDPVVIPAGGIYVTQGSDRRTTGTHYTPRALTEPIVRYALEPQVYVGPVEGKPAGEWRLRTPHELLELKVCDFAMGSAAFLVQACRYLSERLVEAWQAALDGQPAGQRVTVEGDPARGTAGELVVPEDREERLVLARRLVADRCLYGVDRNPMAVEMAKLSLWLITLDKGRAFTFLDHALKAGDSLLGCHDARQVDALHIRPEGLAESKAETMFWYTREGARRALEEAIAKRRQLEAFTVRDVTESRRKAVLLAEADAALEVARLAGDLVAGMAIATADGNSAARKGAPPSGFDTLREELLAGLHDAVTEKSGDVRQRALAALALRARTLLDHGREPGQTSRTPFHWALAFPEVIQRGGFDAIVGNPPFRGGKLISGILGTDYRFYLVDCLAGGVKGHADLCAYFYLRAASLLRSGGTFGLIATNTIAQGDTREVALDQVVGRGGTIYRAVQSRPWPGTAALHVAHVWVRRGDWASETALDDRSARGITPSLEPSGANSERPQPLVANEDKSFNGSYVLGMGFVLSPDEARELIRREPKSLEVLFPYLNGEDLNSTVDQSARRWVINFFDWPIERAEEYASCMRIVRERVKPERERKNAGGEFVLRKPLPQRWWIYADKRPGLYAAISPLPRVLVLSIVSSHFAIAAVAARQVFAHRLCVFPFDLGWQFALLQSTIHELWAKHYSSTLKSDLNYSPSDCFDTFPFPEASAVTRLHDVAVEYHTFRVAVMTQFSQGLTATYNRVHDRDETSAPHARLRDLHCQMDHAVLTAYGWSDLAGPTHYSFRQTRFGLRYTLDSATANSVLERLLELNHQRKRAEDAAPQAPDSAPGKRKSRPKKPKSDPQTKMF